MILTMALPQVTAKELSFVFTTMVHLQVVVGIILKGMTQGPKINASSSNQVPSYKLKS